MLDASQLVLAKPRVPRMAGLVFALQSDRGVTRTGGDGSTVSSWRDQGRGVAAADGTDAERPTYQRAAGVRPSIRGALAKRLDLSGVGGAPNAATFVMVHTRDTGTNTYWMSGTSANMGIIENFTANAVEWFNGGGTDRITITGTRTAGAHITAVTQSGPTGVINVYYDGALTNTKATAAAALLAPASLFNAVTLLTNGTNGDMFEFLYFNRVLSAAALQLLFGRLKKRYNTP